MQPWSTAVIALINVAKSDITMCSSFCVLVEADDDDDGQAQLFDDYLQESSILIVADGLHGSLHSHLALFAAALSLIAYCLAASSASALALASASC